MFSCEFCKISKNTFYIEHLWTTASLITSTFEIWILLRRLSIRIVWQFTIFFDSEHCSAKNVFKSLTFSLEMFSMLPRRFQNYWVDQTTSVITLNNSYFLISQSRKLVHSGAFQTDYYNIKSALSGLRQIFTTGKPLNMKKKFFISPQKLFLFSRCLWFYFNFLVMQKDSLIREIKSNSNFHSLVDKQLQYTY